MEHAGGRSPPGDVGGLRLASFRVTTLLAHDGARRFPAGEGGQHMLGGDRLAPVLRTAAAVCGSDQSRRGLGTRASGGGPVTGDCGEDAMRDSIKAQFEVLDERF